jgi:hypothetical protein
MDQHLLRGMACVFCLWAVFDPAAADAAQDVFLAQRGRAQAVIVVGRDAGQFHRWVAGELQRYVKGLSGAELPIVTSDELPADRPRIVLGGPQANPLAATAEDRQLAQFAGLKPDGVVLKRTELDGVPVLLAGGNDETGTMYAAYELLERLGPTAPPATSSARSSAMPTRAKSRSG